MATDEELLQADRQARQDALDVSRSFIVQAPAGSGKTELLIQRYLHLLATVAEPEEVVAITFTRKAALEMQLRVIEALRQAADGVAGDAAHERTTFAAAEAVLERSRECGWQLPQSPRRMRIQTLDAFCASVARLLPVSSGLGGLMNTVADAGMTKLYRDAATATLDWMASDDGLAAVIERVLAHLDNNTSDYIAYLASMLATREQWLAIVGAGGNDDTDRVRRELEATLAAQVAAQLQLARAEVPAAAGDTLPALARYAGEQLEALHGDTAPLAGLAADRWPDATPDGLPQWRALAGLLLTGQGSVRKRVTRNDGFPPGDEGQKKAFQQVLANLSAAPGIERRLQRVLALPDPTYDDDQWQVLIALFRLLPLAVGELRRLFAEHAVTDHVEVALAAQTALGSGDEPGDAALLLDYRIRHLLVDEMQDTSVGQYRLLQQLTAGWEAGDGRTLFCVGDPMQSIYRFRDAEVGQFLAARQHGLGDLALDSLVLRQNFRSGEHLVHWFNTAFDQVLPARNDIAAGAIRYSACVPVAAQAGRGHIEVHALFDAAPLEEAKRSAQVIARCLAEMPQGDVAVLVRSRTQLPQLLAELRAVSIPYRAVEIDRLTDLPEIIDLLALTRALCHRDDRIAWLALLRGPWVGLNWQDIHSLVRNDRRAAVPELARDADRLAKLSRDGRARLSAFLDRLLPHLRAHAARTLRERVETAWLSLGGAVSIADDDALSNVYRYLDTLEKLEAAGTLPDVAVLERQLDDERVSSVSSDACRVQIMTMHKAKGLQFDHVVLHGLGRTSGRHDPAVLSWMSVAGADGDSHMLISPLGPRTALEKDPLHRHIENAARDADRLELDRLLYVACTRARRSLHLVGSVAVDADGDAPRPPHAASLLQRLWPVIESEFVRQYAVRASPPVDAERDEGALATPPLRRFSAPWTPPATVPLPVVAAAQGGEDRPVDYDWVGTSARHAGTIVHRWLQSWAESGRAVRDLPPHAEVVSRRWARGLGVAAAELDAVWNRVERALHNVVSDERGRWLLSGDGRCELRLTGLSDGRVRSVVIDRLRIDKGEHWIIDYKTSTHEGGDLQRFLAQEVERYRPQLHRYRAIYRGISDAPLRTALYFPLLQQFVEVD